MPKSNRSADFASLTPNVVYSDVSSAIAWLSRAFGFRPYLRYVDPTGRVTHGQMRAGSGTVVLAYRAASEAHGDPRQAVIVLVDDVDSLFDRAKRAGATVLAEPQDHLFGERQCALVDPEGHHWWFTQHLDDVPPEAWGAVLDLQDPSDS